jgi:ATP-dependent Zn protease
MKVVGPTGGSNERGSVSSPAKTLTFSLIAIIGFWLFVFLCLVLLWGVVERSKAVGNDAQFAYSDLFNKVQSGQVLDAVIDGNDLYGHLKATPKDQFHTRIPTNSEDLQKAMLAANVTFSIREASIVAPLLFNVFSYFVLFLLAVPPFWVIFKKAGLQPVFSLLMLVPLVNIAVLYALAFTKWKAAPTPQP